MFPRLIASLAVVLALAAGVQAQSAGKGGKPGFPSKPRPVPTFSPKPIFVPPVYRPPVYVKPFPVYGFPYWSNRPAFPKPFPWYGW